MKNIIYLIIILGLFYMGNLIGNKFLEYEQMVDGLTSTITNIEQAVENQEKKIDEEISKISNEIKKINDKLKKLKIKPIEFPGLKLEKGE